MFSKTCEYAIRAIIFIAQQSKDGTKIGIKDIAVGIDSPEHFIAKILQKLSKKDFVRSVKGPNGGFYMEEVDLNLTIAEIVLEIDGDGLFTRCGMGLKECSEERPCPIHNDYKHIKRSIRLMLERYQIKMFIDHLDFNISYLK